MRTSWALVFTFAGMLFGVGATAGQNRELVLGPPSGIADREFSNLLSVRELSDGTAVVSDRRENRVYHIGFGPDRGTGPVGREGGGPREFRAVGALHPVGRDSTLMVDPRGGRWMLIVRDSIQPELGLHREYRDVAGPYIVGGTSAGWVFTQATPPGVRSRVRADSLFLVRLKPSGRPDTLTVIDGLSSGGLREAVPGWFVMVNPLLPQDEVDVSSQGSVVVVRHTPYRVEWYRSDGQTVIGPDVEETLPLVTRAIKCREVSGLGGPDAPCRPDVYDDWPERVPPFQSRGGQTVFAVSSDRALVHRYSASGEENRYDIFDGLGQRVGIVTLSASRTIAEVTHDWVYVIETDEFGLQTLTRHELRW